MLSAKEKLMSQIIPATADALDERQTQLLGKYVDLLLEYNKGVNLISKKSVREDAERHVEHCLHLARRRFPDGSVVVDWGSGGGLPAIPLAIVFPHIQVIAVDTIGKKTKAIDYFMETLAISNLKTWNGRAESLEMDFHYSGSRATARLDVLWSWHRRRVVQLPKAPEEGAWRQGLLALKGGDLAEEIDNLTTRFKPARVESIQIEELSGRPAEDKFVLSVFEERK